MKKQITNFENITQKKFERILYVKNGMKMTYKEDYKYLWLYRDDTDTHIGTYNKQTKEAWYFPWIGNKNNSITKSSEELMKQ